MTGLSRLLTPKFLAYRGLIGKLTARDRLRAGQLRVLLIADALGPTAQVNWVRPLQKSRDSGDCALWVMEEGAVEKFAAHYGVDVLRKGLEHLIVTMKPDVIVASRYAGGSASTIVQVARQHKLPLVYHIDDNLLAIPDELGPQKVAKHRTPQRMAALRLLLQEADLVYPSTQRLLQQLLDLGIKPRQVMVGNIAGGADIVVPAAHKTASSHVTVGYMASSSHNHDLEAILPAIKRLLVTHPQVRFEFFGTIRRPDILREHECRHHPAVSDYNAFIATLASLQWDVALAPLRLTDFNLAKTNIKWIECTAAGIPLVCSRHPIYEEIYLANAASAAESETDWYAQLAALVEDSSARLDLLASAQSHLRTGYTLGHLRQQVAQVFDAVGLTEKASRLV